MPAAIKSEYKKGTCGWCGDKGTVFADNGLCEDCDNDHIHCLICKEDQHADDICRHVSLNEHFEWFGSGVGVPGDNVKKSFLKLLASMPSEFAGDLRKAIVSERFHTWMISPLIGPGAMLELHGMPYPAGRKWGDLLIKLGGGEEAEALHDGYRWMVSLYEGETPEANSTTIAWIDEAATRGAA